MQDQKKYARARISVSPTRAAWWFIEDAWWPGTLLTDKEKVLLGYKPTQSVLYLFHTEEAALIELREGDGVRMLEWEEGCATEKQLHEQTKKTFRNSKYWPDRWGDEFEDVVNLIIDAL